MSPEFHTCDQTLGLAASDIAYLTKSGKFTADATVTLIGCHTADGGDNSLAKQVKVATGGMKTIGVLGKAVFSRDSRECKWTLSN